MSPSSAASRPWFVNSSLKWTDAPAMLAVRESLPWSLVGLVAGLIAFMALVPVHRPFFASLLERISLAELPAFGVMAVALVFVLAYRLAFRLHLSRVIVAAGAAFAFALALPRPVSWADPLGYLHRVGESGLFLAIIIALAVACACTLARRVVTVRWVADAIGVTVVIALCLALFDAHFSLGNALIAALTPMGHLGDTYAALLIIVVAETLLWICGIHGPATLAAIITPVYVTLQLQNTAAFGQHVPLPHIVVISLFLFVFPGGAGATLPLAALLAMSKVERFRKIGRLTLLPALFNINEPLVFGLPIVFNPFLAVPFVVVPIVLATISYFVIANGIVARPAMYVPASLPTFAATYLATLDVRAIALAFVNIAVATVIYIPFVRAYERHVIQLAEENNIAA